MYMYLCGEQIVVEWEGGWVMFAWHLFKIRFLYNGLIVDGRRDVWMAWHGFANIAVTQCGLHEFDRSLWFATRLIWYERSMSRLKYIFFVPYLFWDKPSEAERRSGGGFLSKRLCSPWKNQRKVPWERPNRLSFTHGLLSSGLAEVDSMAWHASCAWAKALLTKLGALTFWGFGKVVKGLPNHLVHLQPYDACACAGKTGKSADSCPWNWITVAKEAWIVCTRLMMLLLNPRWACLVTSNLHQFNQ